MAPRCSPERNGTSTRGAFPREAASLWKVLDFAYFPLESVILFLFAVFLVLLFSLQIVLALTVFPLVEF